MLPISLYAQLITAEGKETGNGGQGVYKGKDIFLRDIVEKNNCVWKTPNIVRRQYAYINKIIFQVESASVVFGKQLNANFNTLQFCFTDRNLPALTYNNSDDIYLFTNSDYIQIAIYDSGIVFINNQQFLKMDELNKGYVLLHETLHSFYDLSKPRSGREPRLRQFVKNIHDSFDYLDTELISLLIQESGFSYVDQVFSAEDEILYLSLYDSAISENQRFLNLVTLQNNGAHLLTPSMVKLINNYKVFREKFYQGLEFSWLVKFVKLNQVETEIVLKIFLDQKNSRVETFYRDEEIKLLVLYGQVSVTNVMVSSQIDPTYFNEIANIFGEIPVCMAIPTIFSNQIRSLSFELFKYHGHFVKNRCADKKIISNGFVMQLESYKKGLDQRGERIKEVLKMINFARYAGY